MSVASSSRRSAGGRNRVATSLAHTEVATYTFTAGPIGPDQLTRIATAQQRATDKGSRVLFLHTPDGLGRSELSAQLARAGGPTRRYRISHHAQLGHRDKVAGPVPGLRETEMTYPPPSVQQLSRALSAVGDLVDGIRDDQWSAPTPCTDWTVRDVVHHLVGMNLVFVALLCDQPLPGRGVDNLGDDPLAAYRDSGAALLAAFDQPGVLKRTYRGPLGNASGAERLHVRIADLLAHGWDLARATGQPADLPQDLAEHALAFVRVQLSVMPRTGRFDPAQPVADDAPAIDRLVAFLGRPVRAS